MKFSIIIPVYNVEAYLPACYEIILVDDGSTDRSGEMCDSYAERSPLVKVFHKENGGQSSARNYALPYLSGQFVTYVGSDDYVEPNYLEVLSDGLYYEKTDMVTALHWREYPDETRLEPEAYPVKVFSPDCALEEMCYEKRIGTSPWCKLILVDLVKRFPFPEGKICEDLATVYKIIANSRKVVSLGTPLYHYIQREGSTMNSEWKPSRMDVMEASNSILEYVHEKFPAIYPAAIHRYVFSANEVYARAFLESNYRELTAPIRAPLKQYWSIVRRDPRVDLLQKLKYWMMAFSPGAYKISRMGWTRLAGYNM